MVAAGRLSGRQDVTGEGSLDLLQGRVVLEARRLLIYSGLSVSQVAYAEGYDDLAYFSRVFARGSGVHQRVSGVTQAQAWSLRRRLRFRVNGSGLLGATQPAGG